MRISNNEITVHRNETFSLDRVIENKDGSPYIVSKELKNPWLLLTVSSSKFNQRSKYKLSHFLSLKDLPKFNFTQPINLLDIEDNNGESIYYDWPELTPSISPEDGVSTIIMTCYYNDVLVNIEPDDAVFYLEKNGVREYKYFDIETNSWKDYIFRFIDTFEKSETSKWVGQTYQYSILLVSGMSTEEYLRDRCIDEGIETSDDKEEMYNSLISAGFKFDESFSLNAPIGFYEHTFPILVPTNLSVLSNLEGVMN